MTNEKLKPKAPSTLTLDKPKNIYQIHKKRLIVIRKGAANKFNKTKTKSNPAIQINGW